MPTSATPALPGRWRGGDDGTVAAHVAAIGAHESAALPADRALAAGMLSASDAERLLDALGDHR